MVSFLECLKAFPSYMLVLLFIIASCMLSAHAYKQASLKLFCACERRYEVIVPAENIEPNIWSDTDLGLSACRI